MKGELDTFSFVFLRQNGLTIIMKGGYDAAALFYKCTFFTDVDYDA